MSRFVVLGFTFMFVMILLALGCADYRTLHDSDGGDTSDGDAGDDTVRYDHEGDCRTEADNDYPEPDIEIVTPLCTGAPCAYILEFVSDIVGQTVQKTVRLKNVGTADLRIMDLFFEMGTPDEFFLEESTVNRLPIVLAPGEESEFDVFYLSRDDIEQYGILNIISNDPDEARVIIQLGGTLGCDLTNGGVEVCDGIDNDCDGETDEECIDLCKDLTCFDNNPCTDDGCDPSVGCVFEPNADPCDDGDPCTVSDTCTDGACLGSTIEECVHADGCCPAGCGPLDDNDCCESGLHPCETGCCEWDIHKDVINGGGPKVAEDSQGTFHLAYTKNTPETAVRYARWEGGEWEHQIVYQTNGNYLGAGSLVLDADENPIIGFVNQATHDRHVAWWDGSDWEIHDIAEDAGPCSPLVVDSDGNPHIAHVGDETDANLVKYVFWTGAGWGKRSVGEGNRFAPVAIALDSNAAAHIVYLDEAEEPVLAKWTGSEWEMYYIDERDGNVIYTLSMAIDEDDVAHLVYRVDGFNNGMGFVKYARWDGTTWEIEVLDEGSPNVNYKCSLALDSAGRPHVAYLHEGPLYLKYARRLGTTWQIMDVDTTFNDNSSPFLLLIDDTEPVIFFDGSYTGSSNQRYIHYAWW